MAKENVYLKQWKEQGLVDERGVAVVADISCTNGNAGRAFVFINGTTMYIQLSVWVPRTGRCRGSGL